LSSKAIIAQYGRFLLKLLMFRKKTYLFAGIVVMLLLAGNLILKFITRIRAFETERQWYVDHLHYNFSSSIDSLVFIKGSVGLGKVMCSITRGRIDHSVETELNRSLKHHSTLRFNETTTPGKLQFTLPGAERFLRNDSVVVNSAINAFRVYRNGKEIYTDKLYNLLEGRGDYLL
jgi:hypothetical protein